MIKRLNLKDMETANRVMDLQRASYKTEAQIIGFYEIPALVETLDVLQQCDEDFYGYYIDDILAGIISFKIIDDVLDIHRVAIHPNFFRMGIANILINFIERLNRNISKIIVCTGKDNLPAINLYLKNGYKMKKDIEARGGVYITEFEKVIK
ncbi:GNAT family N-acetyltransferase [Lutispora thermophila]|uniref:Acetyltransferase (GNAT) family protein n=1 Tax=Lutispora thermophila DSM 19022 TaxID=1122184 RepID=A0A1M6E486_9FIRM|nr:GNAT family N-acetyltransferase [Lutispora thermophila]SHI80199.1 Acetyltransferase (GNAT) family protein [Lutispora thermophila DSM 19022]